MIGIENEDVFEKMLIGLKKGVYVFLESYGIEYVRPRQIFIEFNKRSKEYEISFDVSTKNGITCFYCFEDEYGYRWALSHEEIMKNRHLPSEVSEEPLYMFEYQLKNKHGATKLVKILATDERYASFALDLVLSKYGVKELVVGLHNKKQYFADLQYKTALEIVNENVKYYNENNEEFADEMYEFLRARP